ncbi:acyltransferase [Uliginosibacterium sp. 31-12]|uniref:acyltransferase family protein n=1 Tax=Uliginosibacterium sp. 31-12 TaxID=3062781 RepID=UPI0026E1547D|nr:acyltransferase [Uliginosibacterium sp. 31-12]MDO6386052.1 acyltransferase [Uliginosibacterium sp. 31-12]
MKERNFPIENMRAVACVFVVFGHVWWISGFPLDGVSGVLFKLVCDGTYYFCFIGGFLFGRYVCVDFGYKDYLRSRFFSTILPYLFFCSIVVSAAVFAKGPYSEYFFGKFDGFFGRYVYPYVGYVLTGRAITGYWFIPMMTLFFLVSPAVVRWGCMPLRFRCVSILAWVFLAGFAGRSLDNINPLQGLFYYMPTFMLGVLFCCEKERLSRWSGWGLPLFLIFFFVSCVDLFCFGSAYETQKPMFEYAGFNYNYFLKMAQVVGLYFCFERWLNFSVRGVSVVSAVSFTIYLSHPVVIAVVHRLDFVNGSGALYWLLMSLSVVGVCVGFSLLGKRVLKGKSRFVLGC